MKMASITVGFEFSILTVMASKPLSTWSYRSSVTVRDLASYATGLPPCIGHAPRSFMEASHCSGAGALRLEYFRTGVVGCIMNLLVPQELVVIFIELA